MHVLQSLVSPESIAVIGASPDESKIRGRLLQFARNSGFAGEIIPINPSYGEIGGLKCYPSLAAVGKPVSLALIAIPANLVVAELERCAAAGVKFASIITSGFAEEGSESATAQNEIAALARRTGMRILGPNSEGFYSAPRNVAATFSPTMEQAREPYPRLSTRRVGIVAQSGGMGFAIFNHGRRAGFSFSHVITTGNEADLTLSDLLDFMVDDAETDVIFLYLETVRDPVGFTRAAERAQAKGKPIVVMKIGQSNAGQRATVSHTASVAGWQVAYAATFADLGIFQALDLEEALSMIGILSTGRRPQGKRLGVITVSGGAGALAADIAERSGLELPVPAQAVQQAIAAKIPSYGSTVNPIDVTAQGSRSGALLDAIELFATSDEADAVLLVHSIGGQHVTADKERLSAIVKASTKPVVLFGYVGPSEPWRATILESGIPLGSTLPGLTSALSKLASQRKVRVRPAAANLPAVVRERLANAMGTLCEYEVKEFLKESGIAIGAAKLARSADEAASAAETIGFPVVMKIQSPDIPHKSEAGGVRLAINSAGAAKQAYQELLTNAKAFAPKADIRGVLVEKMAPAGQEIIIGMLRDETFGPLMMVGLGGIAIELYRDVAYRPAPLDAEAARELVNELRCAPLLQGFRGRPRADIAALCNLIAKLSQIAMALPNEVTELELNPVILHQEGKGLTVADALLTRATKAAAR